MIHQHRSVMKEILLQILFLLPMSFMTFSQQLLRKCNPKQSFLGNLFLIFYHLISIILSQITKDEISKIISSLNSSKSTSPNSIPTKILKLLQVQISKHFTDIFNLSFTTGIFTHSLESAKVIQIHEKLQN